MKKIKLPSRRDIYRYYQNARVRLSRRVYFWVWYKMYVGRYAVSRIFPDNNRVECVDPYEVTTIQWGTFKGIDLEIGNTECLVLASDYFVFEVALLGIRVTLFLEFFADEDRPNRQVNYSSIWGGSYLGIERGKAEHPEPVRIYQGSPNSERYVTEI